MNGKSVSAHGRKTLGEFLLHRVDGGIDPHQGHDPKGNDGHGDAGTKFVAAYGSEGEGEGVAESHWYTKLGINLN